MRHVISGGLFAAALGTALIVAGAFPASAQVARPQSALAIGTDNSDLLTLVAERRGGGGGGHAMRGGGGGGNFAMRGGGGDRSFGVRGGGNRSFNVSRARADSFRVARVDRGDRRRWRNNNWRWRNGCGWDGCGSGLAFGYGLGLGYGLGYGYGDYGYGGYGDYGYGDYAYGGDYDNAVAYCMSRFRTYNPNTGTYIGSDGLAHSCP
jgi:hypothetical protein